MEVWRQQPIRAQYLDSRGTWTNERAVSVLTVFVLEAAELDLVGLVLSLLLQPAGAAGQLVLLLSGFGSALKRT